MTDPLLTEVETTLKNGLAPTHLDITDETHLHAGHAGARGGARHFQVTIVSSAFEGKNALARHRAVNALLAVPLQNGRIHALALTTMTPAEWAGQPDR